MDWKDTLLDDGKVPPKVDYLLEPKHCFMYIERKNERKYWSSDKIETIQYCDWRQENILEEQNIVFSMFY